MAHDEHQVCLCVAEHRPPPLELNAHHVWPRYLGGPDTPDNIEYVCPTTHVNAHEVLRLMLRDGPLTYTEAALVIDRPLSRYAHRLATRGLNTYRAATA